jgi:hypothetical protein
LTATSARANEEADFGCAGFVISRQGALGINLRIPFLNRYFANCRRPILLKRHSQHESYADNLSVIDLQVQPRIKVDPAELDIDSHRQRNLLPSQLKSPLDFAVREGQVAIKGRRARDSARSRGR